MKKLLLLLIPILMMSCKSDSYFAAQNTNQLRFDGWKAENATFLVEANDEVLLIENLTSLALKRAQLKDTYLLSDQAYTKAKNLLIEIQIQAAAKRVKLSSVLSQSSDQTYQRIKSLDEENFDRVYLSLIAKVIRDTQNTAQDYIDSGHTDGLKDFANKLIYSLQPIDSKIEQTIAS